MRRAGHTTGWYHVPDGRSVGASRYFGDVAARRDSEPDTRIEWRRSCAHPNMQVGRSISGRQHDGQDVTVDQMICPDCGYEEWS